MAFLLQWNGFSAATLIPVRNVSPRAVNQGFVRLPGPSGYEVAEPDLDVPVLVAAEIDHAGELFGFAPALVDGLGRHVMPRA